jgi:hypothetical protein
MIAQEFFLFNFMYPFLRQSLFFFPTVEKKLEKVIYREKVVVCGVWVISGIALKPKLVGKVNMPPCGRSKPTCLRPYL